MQISSSIENNRTFFQKKLRPDISFDVVDRNLMIGGRDACLYCIDGFTKDDTLLKVLQAMSSIETAQMPDNANDFAALYLAYGEIGLETDSDALIIQLLSGVPFLLIDGYAQALTIDCRTYPARGVSEPEKDKVLRGSRDGFVETLVFNTALIRRRIRDPKLRMEIMNIGESSHTDIAICYMENRVDTELLNRIRTRIQKVHVDALSMNQESLAECIYPHKWFNPFPKFRFSERPDTSAASILEGNIIILVDNSPSAMILPTTIFDVVEEADDYYFPPVTGTYLRLTRFLIALLTYFVTPTYLLLMNHRMWIPENLEFIILKEDPNVPLILQFLLLELAIDGLRLAAVNTPNMLSTPLSVMAALVLGEFSVESGWFSSEVMLAMAFVAIANYTQANYELGYALKFMRILNLILTQLFGIWGYIAGLIIFALALLTNKTISGQSYLYPLIPFDRAKMRNRFFRGRMPGTRKM